MNKTVCPLVKVILVSCTKRKIKGWHSAADLYVSTWFKLARAYAEATRCQWYILSAYHGLLNPHHRVHHYDSSLHEKTAVEREAWAVEVRNETIIYLPEGCDVEILAGEIYRQHLVPLLEAEGHTVTTPLAGLGIGQQQRWFKNKLAHLQKGVIS